MKYLKITLLYLLLLAALMSCGVLVIKIMDASLTLNDTNIWSTGLKSGVLAWLIMVGISLFKKFTKTNSVEKTD